MNDKEKLQLKVLIKARMNQLRYLIGDSEQFIARQARDTQQFFPQISPETHLVNQYCAEYESLVNSLERLESDRAGLCTKCGEVIDYTRLVAMLDCRFCPACESKETGQ